MIMIVLDIVRRIPDADEEMIRENLEGNLCRCTGYTGIVRAIASQTWTWNGGEGIDGDQPPGGEVAPTSR